AGEGVIALHEGDRAGGRAAAGHLFPGASDGRQVGARARTELEEHGLRLGEVHDRAHVVLDRVDEAGAALRPGLDADVEPDRRIERHLLVAQEMGQLRLEGAQVLVRGEIALRLRPAGDRVDDPVDELADARLALRRPDVAAEVLADHDVGGELRPGAGDLDVLLLEDRLARLVADAGRPDLPVDLVVRMDTRPGPAPFEGQAMRALAVEARSPRP